jgi:hypothetical protein
MTFRRSRTQILYRYPPGAIFDHDRYGICRVTNVSINLLDVNVDSLRSALFNYLDQWNGFGREAFPDPNTEWDEYVVGIPTKVTFEPFPTIVECSICGKIQDLTRLSKLPLNQAPICSNCKKGKFRQLPYVIIHECGRIVPMHVPKCPKHHDQYIKFFDTGRFPTAYWYCGKCDYRRGLLRYQCKCAYTHSPSDDQYKGNEKYLRTNDTSVHYSHLVNFVNLEQSKYGQLKNDENIAGLLFGRLTGLVEDNIFTLIEKRENALQKTSADDIGIELLKEISHDNPDDPRVKQLLELFGRDKNIPGQSIIEKIDQVLPNYCRSNPTQDIMEHVSILDTLAIITPENVKQDLTSREDEAGSLDFMSGLVFANTRMGIKRLYCITDFPIALATIGYSRGSRMPGKALINPYRLDNGSLDGKVPIYAATSNTEAIMLQLDPERIINWLVSNILVEEHPSISDEFEAWVWLKKHAPNLSHFKEVFIYQDNLNPIEEAIFTLLHTISHLLVRQIEWSGFDPESIGEYLLPETLTIIVHSNNYNTFSIGGMVTMFEQRLHSWLKATYNSAFDCTYNPICEDEGASCIGCLHRQYNCSVFNQYLSRAVLQGGSMYHPHGTFNVGYWVE